ncbi:hypothetical protein RF11_15951 [Thelohanellus kitauei]|uniref:Uncharacterized protein n=1 Tax=Thelohanellus kitauei TaxID=669202 RepID=A0A0C2MXY5_THEKT|nr:hypothetical protein RF11_15951 [Thelohanellus kitauei]
MKEVKKTGLDITPISVNKDWLKLLVDEKCSTKEKYDLVLNLEKYQSYPYFTELAFLIRFVDQDFSDIIHDLRAYRKILTVQSSVYYSLYWYLDGYMEKLQALSPRSASALNGFKKVVFNLKNLCTTILRDEQSFLDELCPLARTLNGKRVSKTVKSHFLKKYC